jgi:hypothetical protein
MIQFLSWHRRGGDPLGLEFGGGEHSRAPLGFGSVVARVGDEGAVIEMFKSMTAPPWGGVEASCWLVAAPPLDGKGVIPTVQP